MHVAVTQPAQQRTLLHRFFSDAVEERTIEEYFEEFVQDYLVAQGVEVKLMKASIVLSGEVEAIDVTAVTEKCNDYVGMGLKKVIFEVADKVTVSSDASRMRGNGDERHDDEDVSVFAAGDKASDEQQVDAVSCCATSSTPSQSQSDSTRKSAKKQKSIGFFFGNSIVTKFGRDELGRKLIASSELRNIPADVTAAALAPPPRSCRFCGKSFTHGPAHTQHEKTCELKLLSRPAVQTATCCGTGDERCPDDEGEEQTHEDASEDAEADASSSNEEDGEEAAPVAAQQSATSTNAASRHSKMLKDGSRFKRTRLKEGMKRGTSRTIYLKYEVVQYYRRMQSLKAQGLCPNPGEATAAHFGGITRGQVHASSAFDRLVRCPVSIVGLFA